MTREKRVIEGIGGAGAPRPIHSEVPAASGDRGGAEAVAARRPPDVQAPANSNLARIARDLAAAPPVDAGKVERLRGAIVRGDYQPDPQAIAKAMLALEPIARPG